VLLADGASLEYDSLIVAAGSQSSYYGQENWREWAPSLKSVEEATNVRHKILYAFEAAERIVDPARRRAWLTFVIVGAGPTGVELAGAIAEISRQTLKHDFRSIHPEDAQIILVDGGPRVLASFPEDLAERAAHTLAKLGVQVKTGLRVKGIDKQGLTIQSRDGGTFHLEARTVIWAGGVAVPELAKTLAERTKAETDKVGRIKVGPQLTVAGHPDIYVIGDLALSMDSNGQPLPGVAQVAMQQGTHAAKAIARKIQGKQELPPFKYFDKGSMAVIGRWAAIANAFGLHVSGLLAWFMWAFIHLTYLVQFESRVLVFIQWAMQDVTFNTGARLITGTAATDFNFNKELSAFPKESADSGRIAAKA
jgi:NADH dehydrogenase